MGKYDDRPPRTIPRRGPWLSCCLTGAAVIWTMTAGCRAPGATTAETPIAATNALTFVQIRYAHRLSQGGQSGSSATCAAIADINALPQAGIHRYTGGVSHLSKPEEFGHAKCRELYRSRAYDSGRNDTIDDGVTAASIFRSDGNGKAWYSFDHSGVHFFLEQRAQLL
jgi:hypothetical protein